MGTSRVRATVSSEKASAAVEPELHSGVGHSVLSNGTWRELGLVAKREFEATLHDGTPWRRPMSECTFALDGREGSSPVILCEAHDEPVLGWVTLSVLGLVFDPLMPFHGHSGVVVDLASR